MTRPPANLPIGGDRPSRTGRARADVSYCRRPVDRSGISWLRGASADVPSPPDLDAARPRLVTEPAPRGGDRSGADVVETLADVGGGPSPPATQNIRDPPCTTRGS